MAKKVFRYNANGDYRPVSIKRKSKQTIEHMSVSIGNKNSQKDTTIVKDATNIQEDINESFVVSGMTKMLSSVVNEVANENSADLNQLITLNTTLGFQDIDTGGDFTISNINITTKLDSNDVVNVTQKIQTKVQNDISKKLQDVVANSVNSYKKVQDKDSSQKQSSTDLGSTMSNIAGTVGDTVSNVLSASIGNSTRVEKTNITDTTLNKKIKVDKGFTLQKNDSIGEDIKNALSQKNIADASKKTNNNNQFNVKGVKAGGNFTVKDLNVLTSIKQVLNQTLNQSVLADISTKIVADYDRNVNNMIKSAEEFSKENNSVSTSGDIYAVGVAGKQVLEGVGQAAVGVGEGLSTAAEGAGKGLSTAAEGVGKGIATAAKGFTGPFIIIAIVVIIAGLAYAYLQSKGKAPDLFR